MHGRVVDLRASGAGTPGSVAGRTALGGLRKRAFDITVAAVVLVALAPLLLAIVLLLRLLMGRPIIMAQERLGLGARTFASYHFRTTVGDYGFPSFHPTWRSHSRAEILGDALRASGLDKLPQLFNVLRGEMSLVGPRPITVADFWRYSEQMPEYFTARPGLTGLWRHTSSSRLRGFASVIALDRYYVRFWSMSLDIALLLKTISAIA